MQRAVSCVYNLKYGDVILRPRHSPLCSFRIISFATLNSLFELLCSTAVRGTSYQCIRASQCNMSVHAVWCFCTFCILLKLPHALLVMDGVNQVSFPFHRAPDLKPTVDLREAISIWLNNSLIVRSQMFAGFSFRGFVSTRNKFPQELWMARPMAPTSTRSQPVRQSLLRSRKSLFWQICHISRLRGKLTCLDLL